MTINILHTIRQGKIGGGETHVLDLVQMLDKNLFHSAVISFTDGEMVERLNKIGIKCYVVPTIKPFDHSVYSKVTEIAVKEKTKIIHAHGTRACSNSYRTTKDLHIPLIYTIHGWSFHHTQPFYIRALRKLSERYLVRQAAVNITVSDANRREGIKKLKMPRSIVIKNGVNLNKFNPNAIYKDIRLELNIPGDVTLVGYIVRLTEQKDPLTFIRAIRYVLDREPNINIRFLIVGDGDLKQATIDLAHRLNVLSHIVFQDFRTDIPDILNAIDIYCLPSLWEGLPIGLLEAAAMKKTVIATPADGTQEIITDRISGILVPMKNPEKLAETIIEMHRNKLLAQELADRAYKNINQNYNTMKMTQAIEEVYRQNITFPAGSITR